MMGDYDYESFRLQKLSGGNWTTVPMASFSYRSSDQLKFLPTIYYGIQPDYIRPDDGITIPVIGDETATVTVEVDRRQGWSPPLAALDTVRARFGGTTLFQGKVYRTSLQREKGDASDPKGTLWTFSANIKGQVGIALSDVRCWRETLPQETLEARLARFGITILGG